MFRIKQNLNRMDYERQKLIKLIFLITCAYWSINLFPGQIGWVNVPIKDDFGNSGHLSVKVLKGITPENGWTLVENPRYTIWDRAYSFLAEDGGAYLVDPSEASPFITNTETETAVMNLDGLSQYLYLISPHMDRVERDVTVGVLKATYDNSPSLTFTDRCKIRECLTHLGYIR